MVSVSTALRISDRWSLPATRFAVDAYVNFVRDRSLLEAVASCLTEMFSPQIIAEPGPGSCAITTSSAATRSPVTRSWPRPTDVAAPLCQRAADRGEAGAGPRYIALQMRRAGPSSTPSFAYVEPRLRRALIPRKPLNDGEDFHRAAPSSPSHLM
jgi:hypothetical protein